MKKILALILFWSLCAFGAEQITMFITVTNPAVTYGGSDQFAPAPAQIDRDLLYDQLFATLRKTAANELELRASGLLAGRR